MQQNHPRVGEVAKKVGVYYLQSIGNGRYQILCELGSGTCGITYRGLDHSNQPHLTKYCAIKISKTPPPDTRRRRYLTREVIIMKQVSGHPNIVRFRNYIEAEGQSYIIMDLCDGPTLYHCIRQGRFHDNDLETKSIYTQVLDGVEFLHIQGIYHRDLKPENIILDKNCTAQIVDFGYATRKLENHGVRIGTLPFMCPELLQKENIKIRNERADIWALGIILFEMVAGKVPWDEASDKDS
ncbi:kinase-like domain-containing protein [Cyathus striatus]|nr:kinase-like domain-containing protein [Cyathus striatus]